ncbi:hypothetical protein L596_013463 [Steinernema carpocapsae]|uniref:Uncharacterized protein n=1 Tax=Steinernema carpocapsae TaxID=34508 RepID=A0A4U5P0D3_STECR|nr:hypothetical protein L596_013463 [Steinernema carpocapsae]
MSHRLKRPNMSDFGSFETVLCLRDEKCPKRDAAMRWAHLHLAVTAIDTCELNFPPLDGRRNVHFTLRLRPKMT